MVKNFVNKVINEYHDATMYKYDYEDCFNAMIADFVTDVVDDYHETVHPDPDKRYRECLAEWYAETTLIDYPDRFRKENKHV